MDNAFFLDIQPHKGVLFDELTVAMPVDATDDFRGILLNLLQVMYVRFQKESIAKAFKSDADPVEYPAIRFITEDGQSFTMNFALIFKPEGMGEYHRYKRQIESLVIGGMSGKPEIRVV